MVKPLPAWLRYVILGICAVTLLALFSGEISDSDFWWTLKSGQYIAHNHKLPSPDPFSFTTAMAHDAYPGESVVRQFNLTFEWLAQLIFYGTYSMAGFGGIVLLRALLLSSCCALIGAIAWMRCGGLYRSLAAAFGAASVLAIFFTYDRSYLFTYLFLALTLAILEWRRRLWLLPVIAIVWANCHGGFFLQWIAVGAYCLEAAWLRYRRKPQANERALWITLAACVVASGINPNGYRVLQVLYYFRRSFLQSKLLEWQSPPLLPPSVFSALLFAGAAVLIWRFRRVRLADWLLFAAFAAAALMAQRNMFLVAFWAPVVLVTYVPWNRALPALAHYSAALAACLLLALAVSRGAFQFRVAEWRFPAGAADFLLTHHVTSRMFNTYELGGYLMWRLYPEERVFIDGRALSESVFGDYARILYNHSSSDGLPSGPEVLDRYNIQTIVMNTFEYAEGLVYNLAPSLWDQDSKWKLVYNDPQALIFMREPPPGVQPIPNNTVFSHMEDECAVHLQHEPKVLLCARSLGLVFARIHDSTRELKWLNYYLSQPHVKDPQAEAAYSQLFAPQKR
ncbi:MAG TPA: hypothetical protein VHW24_18070 [Bryobacteraceae bacterium]|nr:hypothetical protein [Bryobacteraceae bacterium]